MNAPTSWRSTWNRRMNYSNWCHCISTDGTQGSASYRPLRIISLQGWFPHTPIYCSMSGVNFCHNQLSHWTYSINPESIPAHLPMHRFMEISTTMPHHLTPPGTKVIVHIKPSIQKNWAPRGLYGWYIDHAKNHYQFYNIYIQQTRAVIHAKNVKNPLHNSKMPFWSSAENSTVAAVELLHAQPTAGTGRGICAYWGQIDGGIGIIGKKYRSNIICPPLPPSTQMTTPPHENSLPKQHTAWGGATPQHRSKGGPHWDCQCDLPECQPPPLENTPWRLSSKGGYTCWQPTTSHTARSATTKGGGT